MSMWIKDKDGGVQSVVPLTDIISIVVGPLVGIALSHFGASHAVSGIAAFIVCAAIFVGGRVMVLREHEKAMEGE